MFGKRSILRILFTTLLGTWIFCGFGQGQVSIYNNSVSIAPGYTVSDGTAITTSGSVVNTGTAVISGVITLKMAVNTSTNASPSYSIISSPTVAVSSFTPGAIQAFSFSVTASGANGFKTDGNGTTVVVWPLIGSDPATTEDSVFTTVTVVVSAGLNELDESFARDVIIQNPAGNVIRLVYDETLYAAPEIFSSDGVDVSGGIIHDNSIYCDRLAKGIYYIRFYHKTYQRYLTRKVLIN